jgi:hypothetical protein
VFKSFRKASAVTAMTNCVAKWLLNTVDCWIEELEEDWKTDDISMDFEKDIDK